MRDGQIVEVINNGPRLRIATCDNDLVVRIRPGESVEIEDVKHATIRDVDTETHEHEHRSLYSSMLTDEPITYRTGEYDNGDGR